MNRLFPAYHQPRAALLAWTIAGLLLPAAALAGTAGEDAPAGADDDGQATPLQSLAPAEPQMKAPPQQQTFLLQAVRFSGATQVDEARLQALAAPLLGRQVSLAELQALAAQITALYRSRGYFLAQAVVPVQEVRDGRVQISVAEGVLGVVDVQVADDAPIPRERVERMLATLQPGQPLDGREYERRMLLLSDLPGIRPRSAVSSGAEAGSSNLVVKVDRGRPLSFLMEADNHGTPESGRARLGGTLRWASPTGHGDNLDLRLMVAEDAHTLFGRLSYEMPVGYDGARIGAGFSRVQYELGGAFRALEATGTANITDLSLSWPALRQRSGNWFVRAGIDNKALTDRFEAVGLSVGKRVQGIGIGTSFEYRDRLLGGGYTSFNLALYGGRLHIHDPAARVLDHSPFGRQTEGGFSKFTVQATRLQALSARTTLYLGAGLQAASRNLDPSEQLSLGGPRAVRAYSSNELLVDHGWLANLELRWSASDNLTPFLLYDIAHGQYDTLRHPLARVNGRSLRGYGLGVNWGRPGRYTVNASLSWPDAGRPLADRREPRLYLQLQHSF